MSSGVRPSATNSVTGPSRAWTQMRNPQAEFGSEPPSYLQTLSFVTRWHLHRRYNPSQASPWPSQPSSILICKISVPILPLLPDGAGVDPRREFSGSALYSTQHLTCMVKPWWASHTSFWRPPLSPPPHTCFPTITSLSTGPHRASTLTSPKTSCFLLVSFYCS